jgi:hypothetical protein
MIVRILKSSLIIGDRSYPRGTVVDVNYDEETLKRAIKLGKLEKAPGGKPVNEVPPDDDDDDDDDLEDKPKILPPTRATPKQPRPRFRGKPVEADDEDDSDPAPDPTSDPAK